MDGLRLPSGGWELLARDHAPASSHAVLEALQDRLVVAARGCRRPGS
jgi:hypothetical protein